MTLQFTPSLLSSDLSLTGALDGSLDDLPGLAARTEGRWAAFDPFRLAADDGEDGSGALWQALYDAAVPVLDALAGSDFGDWSAGLVDRGLDLAAGGSGAIADALAGIDLSGAIAAVPDSDLLTGLLGEVPLQRGEAGRSLAILDPAIGDVAEMAKHIPDDVDVLVLDPALDGVAQITAALENYADLAGLHIVSHGGPASLQLGAGSLSAANLADYSSAIARWSAALAPGADLLFYGCDVAAGEAGEAFVAQLAALTGADVAASDDRSGSESHGGDGEFEVAIDVAESALDLGRSLLQQYDGTLAILNVNTTDDSIDPDDDLLSLREAILLANGGTAALDTARVDAGFAIIPTPEENKRISLNDGSQPGTPGNNFTENLTDLDNGGPFPDTINLQEGATYNISSVTDLAAIYGLVPPGNDNPAFFIDAVGQSGAITINGKGATINLDRSKVNVRLFYAKGSELVINDLTLSNGNSSGDGLDGKGGAIYNDGGDITLNRSSLSGNLATSGGAIYHGSGVFEIDSSTLSGNQATQVGGDKGGGAVFVDGTDFKATNSTFSGNEATGAGSQGGAVFSDGNGATFRFVTITNNEAAGGGDGVRTTGANNLIIYGSILTGNVGQDYNGAVNGASDYNIGGTFSGKTFVGTNGQGSVPANTVIDPTLADNGGPTQTHKIVSGSTAVNQVPVAGNPTVDQRGNPRIGLLDVGSVEEDTRPIIKLNGTAGKNFSTSFGGPGVDVDISPNGSPNGPTENTDTGLDIIDSDDTQLKEATVKIALPATITDTETLSVDTSLLGAVGVTGNGTATLKLTGPADISVYETILQSVTYRNDSDPPTLGDRQITFSVVDASDTNSEPAVAIVTYPVGAGPFIDLDLDDSTTSSGERGYTGTFRPGVTGPVKIADNDTTLTSSGGLSISEISIDISSPPDAAEDLVSTVANGNITVNDTGTKIVLTNGGAATPADFVSVLKGIEYNNTAAPITPGTRSIEVLVTDQNSNTATVESLINVVTDDPPVLDLNGPAASGNNFKANFLISTGDPIAVASPALLLDHNSNIQSVTISFASVPDFTSESLTIDSTKFSVDGSGIIGSTGITRTYTGPTNTSLTLTGVASPATYQSILRALLYDNNDVSIDPTPREISFDVKDVNNNFNTTAKTTIDFTESLAPTLNLNGNAQDFSATFNPAAGPTTIAGAVDIEDIDSVFMTGATVKIDTLFDGVSEILAADTSGTAIVANYDSATGTLTLSGTDSQLAYEQVLSTLTYNNTDANIDATPRSVTFSVTDDQTNTSTVATTDLAIDLTPPPPPPPPPVGGGGGGVSPLPPAAFVSIGGISAPDDLTTPIDLGVVAPGAVLTRDLVIRNSGAGSLSFLNINLPAGFTLEGGVTNLTVPPGSVRTFQVQFSADAAGEYRGNFVASTNDPNNNPYNFPLLVTVGSATGGGGTGIPGGNRSPIATRDEAATSTDLPVEIDVLSNDIDPDGRLDPSTVTVIEPPENGTVTVNPVSGRITYQPNLGFLGVDDFVYTVEDDRGAASNPISVTVTVSELPPPPPEPPAPPPFGIALQTFRNYVEFLRSDGIDPASLYFDETYYRAANPDVAVALQEGAVDSGFAHYAAFGQQEGRDPSALFDESLYLEQNPDVAAAIGGPFTNAFSHFLQYGIFEGRLVQENLFDPGFYAATNPDVRATANPLDPAAGFRHFLQSGQFEGRDPSPLFETAYYLAAYPEVQAAIASGEYASAFDHFIRVGLKAGFTSTSRFDEAGYLAANPDVAAAVQGGLYASGFEQFLREGLNDGRLASAGLFDEGYYLSRNPLVAEAVAAGSFDDGYDHFVQFGHLEARQPGPFYDEGSYLAANPDILAAVQQGSYDSGYEHFIRYGRGEGRPLPPPLS